MLCSTCGSEVLPSFKHAIARNECPACGGLIMGEESLALIEDVGRTILESAAVREETANSIAIAIVTKYNIDLNRDAMPKALANSSPRPQPKMASPSIMKKAIQESNVVVAPRIPEGVSESEREQIMENAVREKYQMVDQIQAEAAEMFQETPMDGDMPVVDSLFSEGASSPLLERERLERLARQRRVMEGGGGGGSFRRSG